MDIVTKPRGELVPYENNPRHNDEAVEYVANSIKEFGWKVPIVIDKNNVVVAGHTRLKAAEMLGIDEIPCIIADDLSEDQIKAYRLADNKVADKAYWDFSLLYVELDEIELDMSEFGFDTNIEDPEGESPYTDTVNIPQYEPKGEEVEVTRLTDTRKYEELLEAVEDSEAEESEKEFLRLACARHIAFNYREIAEYYANASEEMQELMEELALVIIDVNDAIAKGYAVLKNSIEEIAFEGVGDD